MDEFGGAEVRTESQRVSIATGAEEEAELHRKVKRNVKRRRRQTGGGLIEVTFDLTYQRDGRRR